MEPRVAVKSFIVNNGKVLLVKRHGKDENSPSIWEVPGGRLDSGENPIEGLKREVKEEVGIDVDVVMPFAVEHFSHPEDGQVITMLHFLCKALSEDVVLSKEHTGFEWIEVGKSKDMLSKYFHHVVDAYEKFELEKHV